MNMSPALRWLLAILALTVLAALLAYHYTPQPETLEFHTINATYAQGQAPPATHEAVLVDERFIDSFPSEYAECPEANCTEEKE